MKKSFLTITLFTLALQVAQADTTKNPVGPWYMQDYDAKWWRVDGLVGWGLEPSYPGSDETDNEFAGLLRLMMKDPWNNRYAVYPLGVSGSFDLTEDLNFLVQIEYEAGGDGESADFEGLDEIDDTIDGNFALSRRWGNAYLYGSLQPDLLGRGKGLVWFAGGGYDWQATEELGIRTRLGLTGGDDTHMDTEFNITAEESERTGLSEYDPKGGIKNLEVAFQVEYAFNEHWSLFSLNQIEHYFSEAADSPLIQDIGTETTVLSVAGIFFRW